MLTLPELEKALPPHLKNSASQHLVDLVNNVSLDPQVAEDVKHNFVSFTGILRDGRFKTEDYLNAVVYVSHKLMGESNREAYSNTFPKRYQALVARGASDKDISAYVSIYNKRQLVNLILEQTMIPTWVLNQETYQQAINTQAALMVTSKSDLVRTQAANSILTHLKRPETKQIELNIGIQETSGMKELKDMLTTLAEKQQSMISDGVPTKEIAHHKLAQAFDEVIDAEVVNAEKSDE
jgi:hypothetical protein